MKKVLIFFSGETNSKWTVKFVTHLSTINKRYSMSHMNVHINTTPTLPTTFCRQKLRLFSPFFVSLSSLNLWVFEQQSSSHKWARCAKGGDVKEKRARAFVGQSIYLLERHNAKYIITNIVKFYVLLPLTPSRHDDDYCLLPTQNFSLPKARKKKCWCISCKNKIEIDVFMCGGGCRKKNDCKAMMII